MSRADKLRGYEDGHRGIGPHSITSDYLFGWHRGDDDRRGLDRMMPSDDVLGHGYEDEDEEAIDASH